MYEPVHTEPARTFMLHQMSKRSDRSENILKKKSSFALDNDCIA